MMEIDRKKFYWFAAILLLFVFSCFSHAEDGGVPLSEIGDMEVAGEESLYDELPRDHWVYRAVERLAGRGLLDGYQGAGFRPDQLLTTYELAVIVENMVGTYNSVIETGLPPSAHRPAAPAYAALPGEEPDESAAPPEVPSTITLVQVLDTPVLETVQRQPRVQKKKKSAKKDEEPARPGEAWLEFSDVEQEPPGTVVLRRAAGPMVIEEEKKEEKAEEKKKEEEKEAPKEEEPKEEKKDKKSKKKKDKDKKKEKDKKAKLPKEMKGLEKKVELTDKDIAVLQALVDYVSDEVKSVEGKLKKLKAALKKDLSGVKKMAARNEADIERLQQEHQRFKVTGSGTVQIKSYGDIEGDTSVSISDSASFSVYSRPRKFQDMVLRTNLSGSYADIRYQNFERKGRNFMARSLNFGPTSASFSFLTLFGKSFDGHAGEFLLNDYTLKYYYGSPGSSAYTYGASLQSTMFGEPKSFVYLSRIFIYEDASVKDDCQVEVGGTRYFGTWSGDTLCVPPYKNSVTSVFFRYPLIKGIYLSSEFAHSTFYREGFKSMYGDSHCKTTDSDGNCTEMYFNDPTTKYLMGSTGWRVIPELRDQDDAFYFFLDYAKDNLTIFPLGYARLGSKFASKYFGLPGMDLDDFGIDVLPINIQSLEAFVAMGAFDKKKDRYKLNFTAAHIRETEPMLFDLSAMPKDFQQLMLIDKFPSRTNEGLLSFRIFQNKLTYYISNRMNFSYDYMYGRGGLGPDCLDGDLMPVKNDKGEVIDYVVGNGIRDCSIDNQANDLKLSVRATIKTQTYKFWMRTSKKGEYELEYKSDELLLKLDFGEDSSAQVMKDLFEENVPYGTEYSFNNKFKYRLTDVSRLEFWYNYKFGRPFKARVKDDSYQDVGFKLYMSF